MGANAAGAGRIFGTIAFRGAVDNAAETGRHPERVFGAALVGVRPAYSDARLDPR